MKRTIIAVVLIIVCSLASNSAIAANENMSDNIKGRLGVTGKLGFLVPADSDAVSAGVVVGRGHRDTGFIGGGGFIFGFTDRIAAEFDITHSSFGTDSDTNFDTTNISMGVQYRCPHVPVKHLVPYAGAGLDILLNGADNGLDVDNAIGVHVKVGVDYFVMKQLALTSEIKGIIAANSDITTPGGNKVGEFDPDSFSMTF